MRLAVVIIGMATLTFASVAYTRSGRIRVRFAGRPKTTATAQSKGIAENAGLSAEGLQQIAALLAEKESRTPEQRKLASQLLQAVKESRGQQMAAGVNLEPANVNSDSSGMTLVDITANVSDSLIDNIEKLGGEIIFPSAEYKAIRARVPLSTVETIAGYSEVTFIRQAALAMTSRMMNAAADDTVNRSNSSNLTAPVNVATPVVSSGRRLSFEERASNVRAQLSSFLAARAPTAKAFIGRANSQGDKAHQADTARAQYGFAGEGIKIGVMSDSFNFRGGLAADIAGGDLPGPGNPFGNTTPVTIVQDLPNPNPIVTGSDEGRAMMQIVHDLAPKAQLFFASAFISEAGFATNIKRLRDAPNNCDIVIDDVFYSDEGVFQDSIVAQAVNYVTASGGLYFSSAGNQGSVQRNTSSVWEGDFKDGGTLTIPGNTKTGTVHDFSSTATPILGNIILSNGGFVYSVDWSDPLGASTNDYDLFIVNAAGTTVKAASTNIQNGMIDPHEEIGASTFTLTTNSDRIVVFKSSTAAVRAMSVNGFSSRLTVFTSGQTHGHSSAADAFSVAAANGTSTANTVNGLFTTASRVETFSSDGPRRIFYNADGSVVTPGNILFATNGGTVRQKPDITAADAVATSGNSLGGGLNPFSGTSAAAPHAGAIAALIKSAKPSLTPAQIRTIMTTAVIDIEVAGVDNATGFGIVNANAAVLAAMSQQADLTLGTVTTSEGSFKNSNGVVEPGETANIVVQLNNPSLTNALNVNATLTTSTPGVTVIQSAASYGTINAGGNASNSGTPFIIGVNQSVACGTTINLSLTATLTNGTPLVAPITVITGGLASISGTLTLPASGAGFTSTTGTEPSRVNRANPASTCAAPKVAPATTAGSRRYDAYVFTNPTAVTQCVTISGITSSNAATLGTVTYNNSGFVPATPAVNFLADSGNALTNTHSFNVPAGQSFTTVIYEINANGGTGVTYSFNVVLGTCIAGPTCTPVIVTPGSIASGSTGSPYSQSFGATGGSGSYTFSLTGSLPAGLGFSGNTLSGTPTQAGSFPITVTANDASCPAGSQNYTLVISGTAPASITATAGDGQSVLPNTAFPIALQATVRDGAANLLSGVAVTFAAPPSGASGTFTGGVSSVTVVTNGSGVATAPTFTANATTGSYIVTATVNGLAPVNFNLSNTCPGSFVVTSNGDNGAGTLRDVIGNACAGATVTFAPGVTGMITLTTGELMINKSITINGPGANVLAVSGNHLSRIFHIIPGTGNTVSISGLTIKDGSSKADG
ncbi:MAG TPA: S8 family serine peptidase, partial [Blastocatellia bacterium]|nr:S8 family serine peptidase [Blastocatellia bacterium]